MQSEELGNGCSTIGLDEEEARGLVSQENLTKDVQVGQVRAKQRIAKTIGSNR